MPFFSFVATLLKKPMILLLVVRRPSCAPCCTVYGCNAEFRGFGSFLLPLVGPNNDAIQRRCANFRNYSDNRALTSSLPLALTKDRTTSVL